MFNNKHKLIFISSLGLTVFSSYLITNHFLSEIKFTETDISINMPSYNSNEYKNLISSEDLITNESTFKILGNNEIYVNIESDFVNNLRNFTEKYINTLKENDNNATYKDFFIEKEEYTLELIKYDFDINEPLFQIYKSNFKILNSTEGGLEANGVNAYLDLEIQFTVDDYKDDSLTASQILEKGATYTQKRSLHLQRCENNTYKISEQFIGNFIKVTS